MSLDGQITLEVGGTSITVNSPQRGYNTTIHRAMERGGRLADGSYLWYDEGYATDYRLFRGTFQLPEDQQKDLQDFFSDDSKGRGAQIRMIVPEGISPFAPDYGEGRRKYEVRLIDAQWGGSSRRPWKRFVSQLEFSLVSAPSYSLPDPVGQGTGALRIGGMVGFRFPPGFYSPETHYEIESTPSWGGGAEQIDGSTGRDWTESKFQVVANRSMSARLLRYLTQVSRGNTFTVRGAAGSYVFGRDNTDTGINVGGGSYVVRAVDADIEVVHLNPAQWSIGMNVLYRSYAGL